MKKITSLTTLLLVFFFSSIIASEKSRTVLVTGGAGFLGSNLCGRLLEDGHNVVCLDNLFTGRMENIQEFLENPRFVFVNADVTQIQDLDFHLDEIFNLACPASPPHYQKDPVKTVKTSVFGAIFVLELAKKNGAKVFQASTSEVYGDPLLHPQTESYWGNVNPIGIRSCYDEGKRCAETLFFDYHRQYGVRIKVGRIFNTYGPKMDPKDGRVVSNFIIQALKGEPITVYGEGQQTRSFCYVDDLVDAFIKFMDTTDDVIGPINLGNPNEFNMLELAQKVIRITHSRSQIVYLPLPGDDPKMRKPDITLARKYLNWSPRVELEEGLGKTVEYFKGISIEN